jgi:hypothetical protein
MSAALAAAGPAAKGPELAAALARPSETRAAGAAVSGAAGVVFGETTPAVVEVIGSIAVLLAGPRVLSAARGSALRIARILFRVKHLADDVFIE